MMRRSPAALLKSIVPRGPMNLYRSAIAARKRKSEDERMLAEWERVESELGELTASV